MISILVLLGNPLRKHQYAQQPGKLTRHALKHLENRLAKPNNSKEVAIGCFLDIEGVFVNTRHENIHNGATEHIQLDQIDTSQAEKSI